MIRQGWFLLLVLATSGCDFDDEDDKDDYEECMEKVGATAQTCRDDD